MQLNDSRADPISKCRRRAAYVISMVAVTGLGACTAFNSATPENSVRDRAKQRWVALMSGDTRAAYELTTPSFRSVSTLDAYKAKFGATVNLIAAEVVSVTCEPEKCAAVVRVDAKALLGGQIGNTISTHVDETWLLEDGRWWFFQKL